MKDEPIAESNLFDAQLSPLSSDGPAATGPYQQMKSANAASDSPLWPPQTEVASNQFTLSREENRTMHEEQTRVASEQESYLKAENETLQGTVADLRQASGITKKTEKHETAGTGPIEGIPNIA